MMFTLQPGQNQKGQNCLHCIKSMKTRKTYCNIAAHHQVRLIKKKYKSSDTLEQIKKISHRYSYQNLIISVVMMFPDTKTLDDINRLSSKVVTTQLATYLINLHLSDPISIQKYLEYIHHIKKFFPNIQEAKIQKKVLYQSNLLDIDVIIRNNKNELFGLVRGTNQCIFHHPLSKLVDLPPDFQSLKKEHLEFYGYYNTADAKNQDIKDNMAYSPGRNKYWENLIELIENHKVTIANKICQSITFPQYNFPVFLLHNPELTQLNSSHRHFENMNLVIDTDYLKKASIRFYLVKNGERLFCLNIFWSSDFYKVPEFTLSLVKR